LAERVSAGLQPNALCASAQILWRVAALFANARCRNGNAQETTVVRKRKESDLNIIIWLVVGGVLGWLASLVMRTDGSQGVFLNVVVGIVGAMIGGFLLSPLLGSSTINQGNFSLSGLFVSFLGAVILLAIVNFFRRGRAR
jgi:uncharacterized membrane protein YeaQ/YmgE (transglycosylase-associated protein family)